jgi:hypothetical protein
MIRVSGKVMIIKKLRAQVGAMSTALIAVFLITSCGGSSSNSPAEVVEQPTTGTVGLLFTDAPTDDYKQILLSVTEAILIGGDDSQEVLFQGDREIDLLNLENYSEPVVFGEAKLGTYKKIRLQIADLELVPHDDSDSIFPALPANGKIDLLQPDGFDVLPGRTVLIEIDLDADKSLKITGAGNSGRVQFRPVVFVTVFEGGSPNKLARLEGAVSGAPGADSFVLCAIDAPDHCVHVATNGNTSIFDATGTGADFGTLADGNMVVVIGEYSSDPIVLIAIVLEIGGTAMQVKGDVVSDPVDSEFLMLANDDTDLVVEIQPGTKYYDNDGPVSSELIVLGAGIEVEGVKPEKADEADPDLMRAALIFLLAEPADQRSGTIAEPIDSVTAIFVLSTDTGDINVCVMEDARILLVDTDASEVTAATFADLAVDQIVDVFGAMAADDGCFEASEVIVDITPPPAP